MPDTLPRPEAAGPSFPVKHLSIRHDKHVVISPSSPTRAGSITPTPNGVSLKQSGGQDLTHFARRALTFGGHSPLLSERESIFATHYTPVENDPSTPRLPPLAGVVAEPSSPQPLNPDMEFSLPPLVPTPAKLSIRSSLTAARSGSGGIAGGLKQYGSEKSADKQIPANNATIHGIRRVASDGHPRAMSFHIGGGHSTLLHANDQPQATLEELSMEADTAQTEVKPVQRQEEQEHGNGPGAQRQSAMSQVMRPTRSERSVSRGRTHVDKSIEATLTNAEPGQNIRSRKSSHLMGVFRENTSPLESRQRETNVPHAEEGDHAQTISRPSMPSCRTSSRPTSATTTEAILAQLESAPQENGLLEQNQSNESTPDEKLGSEPPSSQVSATPKLPQSPPPQPKSSSKHDHDPYYRKQDAIKQSKGSNISLIPTSLLEQIREHHNLVPMRGQGSHLPLDRTGFTGHEETDFADRRQLRAGDIRGQIDENEEHISSAVYFPHPVPMEDIERFNLPEGGQLITGAQAEIGAQVPVSVQTHNDFKRPSMDLAPSEHIDISVQSKHEKRVFHGDYQPLDEAQDDELDRDILPSIKEQPTESYTIASDSEVESGEDVGAASQTDDDEITPTATPILASQPRRRERPSFSAGPKGAVLLEPYSHQVGGHSTIFRFSRRAVCKQLNNRENEFYERIERRHPDLLRFLPRYIGVLNVTFSKGPKPSKDTSGDAHKIPEDSKVSQSESKGAVTVDKKLNIPNEKKDPPRVAENQQRIVSHSQQIGEMPQVILEQNRHIVPFSLFDFAKRPRTTEPQDSNDHRPFKPDDPREPDRDPHQLVTPTAERPSPARPLLPNQPSWGKTSVNSKFGEQIWRDAFTPPPIHHYKKHAKGHTTLPRVREPSIRRRGNLSADPIGQNRRTASIPADEQRIPAQAEEVDSSKTDNKTLATPSNIMPQDTYSMSASAFEDLSHVLEKVKTTNSISSEGSQVSRSSNKIRRRHSGMGLRRRGNSVHDRSRGNLEYYDEEGYGGDGEDEVFRMESDRGSYTAISAEPSSTIAQDLENAAILTTVHNDAQEVKAHGDVESALHETSTSGSAKQPVPDRESSLNHLPLNPKEAQLAKPDERVVFFLLLEDLTADMGRPCVLDLKMGTRQYGIEANPKKMESQRRKCKTTTSQQLGVRICGMQTFNVKKQQPAYEDKYFGRDLKAGREFREALIRFLYDGVSYSSVAKRIPTILDKISKLESMVRRLPGYRFYASSLLMLYDAEPGKSQRAKDEAAKGKGPGEKNDEEKEKDKDKDKKWLPPIELKIVDFANCVTGEDPLPPNATCPPFHPGAVDRGYLRGLRTLKMYFQRILRDITESEFIERGDGEATGVDLVGAGGTHGGSEIGLEEDEGEVSI